MRYVADSSDSSFLVATNQWDITPDLPPSADPNMGFEGITWIPDSFLVSAGFVDVQTNALYSPSDYPNHGNGLFFVGYECEYFRL